MAGIPDRYVQMVMSMLCCRKVIDSFVKSRKSSRRERKQFVVEMIVKRPERSSEMVIENPIKVRSIYRRPASYVVMLDTREGLVSTISTSSSAYRESCRSSL
jgi:hypothetical protein